jgi:mannose-6-phosphate isomerase
MLYPLTFRPIFKERIWGGRKLESLYHKPLPAGVPIGESWEISDRPGDASVIATGSLAGKDLRWVMEHHLHDLLGDAKTAGGRFPLLIKLLDARETLSLQVHPPAHTAAALGGDPKTEMWYIAQADPGAELYAGLRRGVTRDEFERSLQAGTVAECFHRLPVQAGSAMFLPSGRVHALGAGIVLFEIQQNSDTTYRVFDWNRPGLDGKPRELHVPQSLASIDFEDFEPALVGDGFGGGNSLKERALVRHELFSVREMKVAAGAAIPWPTGKLSIAAVVTGEVVVEANARVTLSAGEFCLLPASLTNVAASATESATVLCVEAGG